MSWVEGGENLGKRTRSYCGILWEQLLATGAQAQYFPFLI